MFDFTIVSETEVKRITHAKDETIWIEVRAALTKSEFDHIIRQSSSENNVQNQLQVANRVVDDLVVDWSVTDSTGTKVPFDAKSFSNLNAQAANWVTAEVMKHFNNIVGAAEEAEGKPEE